jgi:GNAT superfamily N-acetyltransferase
MADVTMDERVARGVLRLGEADAGEVLTLQLAAWVREGRANGTIEIPPLQEGLPDVVAQLSDPALTVWGVRERGRLLAIARTSLLAESVAFLGRLGVVPDLVGQGLGSAMLRHAERALPPVVTRVELVTGIRSVANHAFYERHGYTIIGRDEAVGIVRMAASLPHPRPTDDHVGGQRP